MLSGNVTRVLFFISLILCYLLYISREIFAVDLTGLLMNPSILFGYVRDGINSCEPAKNFSLIFIWT